MKKISFLFFCIALLVFAFPAYTYTINWAEALQKSIYFYDANICGPNAADASRLDWRGNCHIWDAEAPHPMDSGTIDVSGGFHDCGDHVKFGQPQVYAIATLGWGYYEFKDAFIQTGQQQHMLDVLKWGCDYLLRCTELDGNGSARFFVYMVGKGGSDHVVWISPELQTTDMDARPLAWASPDSPASEMCGGASAALSLMFLNYQEIDAAYADKCLTYAKALYTLGREHEGLGTGDGFYNSRDFEDDLSWAAVWLYVCTGDEEYIRHIDSYDSGGVYTGYMKKIISTTSNTWQNIWVHCWDATWGGVFTKLACLFPDREDFDYFGRWNLEFWTGGDVPHEDASDGNYLEPSPAGYAMINTWGSARYNTAAQLCCLVYHKYHPEAEGLVEWARGQMEYILGDNPMGYSYMVGYPSPEESVKHPHHRAAHGSKTNNMNDPPEHEHILWGALVGGPDGDDKHVDDTTDFVYNEVGVDYNAAHVGALAGHYLLWDQGSEPVADFPPPEPVKDEFFAEAKLEQDNSQRTQITIRIHNETTCPPRYEDGISCRYYFDISELYEHEQDISDVSHQIMYDELSVAGGGLTTTRTGPVAHGQDAGIYYMEYAWEYDEFYADLELHFALVAAQDSNYEENWDSSNDFSRQGVGDDYAINSNIPVYLDGVLVYGSEPGGGGPTDTPTPSPTPVQGTPTPSDAPTPSDGYTPGDVNEDDSVDIIDALLVAQYYVGLDPQSYTAPLEAGDANRDDAVDIIDALLIAQYYVGVISQLPPE